MSMLYSMTWHVGSSEKYTLQQPISTHGFPPLENSTLSNICSTYVFISHIHLLYSYCTRAKLCIYVLPFESESRKYPRGYYFCSCSVKPLLTRSSCKLNHWNESFSHKRFVENSINPCWDCEVRTCCECFVRHRASNEFLTIFQ